MLISLDHQTASHRTGTQRKWCDVLTCKSALELENPALNPALPLIRERDLFSLCFRFPSYSKTKAEQQVISYCLHRWAEKQMRDLLCSNVFTLMNAKCYARVMWYSSFSGA